MLISRHFFDWARNASATQRAAGAAMLVCDFLHADLTDAQKAEVDIVLTGLLADPSPLVRRAMAEGFAPEPDAPRRILLALADDRPEIAAITLGKGVQFSPDDLAAAVAHCDRVVHLAIARRPGLHARVSEALAACADLEALVALADNLGADISERAMLDMLARASRHAALRESLLRREALPPSVRAGIASAVSEAVSALVAARGWLPGDRLARVLREARDAVIVTVAREGRGPPAAAASLARQLRISGQLTPALLIRSLLGGDALFFNAALAELAQTPLTRAVELAVAPNGPAFVALYARAGLPESARPVFAALLRGLRSGARLHMLPDIAAEACAAIPEAESAPILALLRKLGRETAPDRARVRGA